MTGGVDKVENIFFAVGSGIIKTHGTGLDGDTSFLFKLHIVEKLFFHVALGNGIGIFENSVRKGGLTVVDMSDNGEISDMLLTFSSFCISHFCSFI